MNSIQLPPFLDRKKSDACVHCGLCLQVCPTFLETGNENDSPRGRIHLMRGLDEVKFPLTESIADHIDRCLGCRACEAVCPSGVEYGGMLEATRHAITQHRKMRLPQQLLQKVIVERMLTWPNGLRLAVIPARGMRRLGLTKLLPQRLRKMVELIPQKPTRFPQAPSSRQEKTEAKVAAGIMSGCVASVFFPGTNQATVAVAESSGYSVDVDSGSRCCGAIHAHSGNLPEARKRAQAMIEFFENTEIDIVVVNAAGCGSTMKEYPQLFNNNSEWKQRADQFSSKVRDVTEIVEYLPISLKKKRPDHPRTTYHDACHLCHAQHITEQPRALMQEILGNNFIELPESDVCCGSAGSYNITQPELAQRLGARKAKNIISTGAKVVVTSNIGCIMQIRASLQSAGAQDIAIIHIADWTMQAKK
ncbi:MAG: (Fe-S)-binding protein [Chlorobi bacterium]|nr:(Fe-S)-binding protein [Chlorobiota bacterium]